jgi:hypothetical protein
MAPRRRRPTKAQQAAIDAAVEQRAAAKRAKRGRADERAAFLASTQPDIDRPALRTAVAALVAESADDATDGGSDDAPEGGVTDGGAGGGRRTRTRRAARPLAFPTGDARRWVPIGPSVVRRGQAEGRPRVSGRIRDIVVDDTGQRAYAASAKGGVWYTRDGGSTWDPLGGWAAGDRGAGGINTPHACGTVMVAFDPGGDEDLDLVMVGTGEPQGNAPDESVPVHGGVGVFAAVGPAGAAAGVEPWEPETGLALLAGAGVYRLARDPVATPGKTVAPRRDRVLAATTGGLFLGTRTRVPAIGSTPQHDEYRWVAHDAGLTALLGVASPHVTDVVWLPGDATTPAGVVVVSFQGAAAATQGVAVSVDSGATFRSVGFGANPPVPSSRTSLAAVGTRVYVLGEQAGPTPEVWQIPSVVVAAPASPVATPIGGLPGDLWPNQRDYDQAIAVDTVGGNDRIYVGGSVVQPFPNAEWSGSLWAFQTPVPPAAPALTPVPGVSAVGAPPGGDGADQAGLIGNNIHGDIHAIRVSGPAGARQVWVACDGGIYRSDQAGRVNTFQPRVTGLAALEVGFHAPHPTSSHFGAIGCQDNGAQVRVGDTVWEATFLGDGGGVAFHPTRPQYVVAQFTNGSWFAQPAAGFFGPMSRFQGGGVVTDPNVPGPFDAEDAASAFYSGVATIARTATESRLAIGTDRVWLCDDVGVSSAGSTWRVIGFPNGPGTDQAGTSAAPAWVGRPQQVGPPAVVAPTFLGPVIRLRWASPTVLLALYQQGIVRYTQTGANWATTIISPGTPGEPSVAAGNELFTDIATLPMVAGVASDDFYLVTTGNTGTPATDTCFFYDSAANQFVATNLRRRLDPAPGVNGPLDPAFAVVVDPTSATDVYVGTVTGVWHATRGAGNVHVWDPTPMVNGLPEATVQDLSIWHEPADPGAPRLLRAAIQSRGVWEVDLAAANETQRTYARVHERDDRRRFPTPMANPRRRPTAPAVAAHASPDVVVRPRWPVASAPSWRFGAGRITGNAGRGYQLWTFQTAFRWIHPSIVADGQWTDQLADLIELERSTLPVAQRGRFIDQALWDTVVGGTRLAADGQVSATAADPLAVYRPPWHHRGALAAPATEIDLIETVLPQDTRAGGTVWRVHKEPVTVDVLVHHRDTRPLAVDDAFAIVLWRSSAGQAAALGHDVSNFVPFARSLLTGAPQADPAGWNVAVDAGGSRVHRLGHALDARLPKAIPVDIDLSAVPDWHRVLVVAIVGSDTDALTTAPTAAVTDPASLVRQWPHAAMRLVQVVPRP